MSNHNNSNQSLEDSLKNLERLNSLPTLFIPNFGDSPAPVATINPEFIKQAEIDSIMERDEIEQMEREQFEADLEWSRRTELNSLREDY